MLGNTETQYIEPQSMNFDKKLTEAYKEFKEYVQKKGPQQAAQDLKRGKQSALGGYEKDQSNEAEYIDNLDDHLFELPMAIYHILRKMND